MSKIRLPLCHHRRLGAAQGDERLDEAKLYKELGVLTKEKEKWEESIPYVSSLLNYESVKIVFPTDDSGLYRQVQVIIILHHDRIAQLPSLMLVAGQY